MEAKKELAVVVLAAGKGTRMKSPLPKVLHPLAGKPMILHVMAAIERLAPSSAIVVVGHGAAQVEEVVSLHYKAEFALQKEQNGTGHAVQCAMGVIPASCRQVLVVCGDTPLLQTKTLQSLVDQNAAANEEITLLGLELENPKGYGRVVSHPAGGVERIVEEKDASETEREIRLVNSGVYCFNRSFLGDMIGELKSENAQSEFYLTDMVGIGRKAGKRVGLIVADRPDELCGVNSPEDLRKAESLVDTAFAATQFA